MRTWARVFLSGLLAISLVSGSAQAVVTIDSSGVPSSDGFENGTGTLTGVTIETSSLGNFTTYCPVKATTAACPTPAPDPIATLRVIPADFNSSRNDICGGTAAWTTLEGVPTVCSFNSGGASGAQPGRVTAGTITRNGCGSWVMTWAQMDSALYYVHKHIDLQGQTRYVAFRLWGTIRLSNYAPTATGDEWAFTATMIGEGKSTGSGYTYRAEPFELTGVVSALGKNCSAGDSVSDFQIKSLSGLARVFKL